jgi:hypothetical protein
LDVSAGIQGKVALRTISNVPVANDVLDSLVVIQALALEMRPGAIDDLLEARNGDGDVVFVCFTLLGHGFGDTFTQGPDPGELFFALGHDAGCDQRSVCAEESFEKI